LAVKPTRAWLHIVPKRQADIPEMSDFLAVFLAEQIHYVGYAQGPELLRTAAGGNQATKGQPFGYKICLHVYPLGVPPNPFTKHMIPKRFFKSQWPCEMSHLPCQCQ
jgi:hypothetical protein